MEHNVLHEQLIGRPKKVEMLKQEFALKLEALPKVETRVKEAKKITPKFYGKRQTL
jgi:hypothetical protein